MAIGIAAFIPYGWVLQLRVHLAAPLVLQFIIGFCFVASLSSLNTLLVDLFPDRPATAAAACNLVRCCLGAVGAAVINEMLSGMGWGWCFVFLGLVMAVGMSLLWIEWVYGIGWREKRLLKIERKEREKEAAKAGDVPVEEKTNEEQSAETERNNHVQEVVVEPLTDTVAGSNTRSG
jgi:MFS family permease